MNVPVVINNPGANNAPALANPLGGVPQGPHDIEELIPYVVPWGEYAIIAAIVLGVILVLVGLWYWLKKRKKIVPTVEVDHWAQLSKSVQNLQPEPMLAAGQEKELYFQMSLHLRTAIEMATGLRATDMTFRELAPLMAKKLPVRAEEQQAMKDFLKTADLVKFADRPATLGEATHFKQSLLVWVVALKPRQTVGLPSDQIVASAAATMGKAGSEGVKG